MKTKGKNIVGGRGRKTDTIQETCGVAEPKIEKGFGSIRDQVHIAFCNFFDSRGLPRPAISKDIVMFTGVMSERDEKDGVNDVLRLACLSMGA
jgi:hypothetical protein